MKFIDYINNICKQYSEKAAIIACEEVITHAEFREAVLRTAQALHTAGMGLGSIVCMHTGNVKEFIYTFFACSLLGAAFIPMDQRYREEEIEHVLNQTGPHLLITGFERVYPPVEGKVISLEHWTDRVKESPLLIVEKIHTGSEYDFLIQFTSGSTGMSKGVIHTERSMMNRAVNYTASAQIKAEDALMAVLPISHSYALGSVVVPALLSGATLVLEESFIPVRVLRLLKEYKVTVFHGVPFMYSMLVSMDEPGPLERIRLAVSASAPLDTNLYTSFFNKYGVRIQQEYGSTETGPICLGTGGEVPCDRLPVGKPLANTSVKIVNSSGCEEPGGTEGTVIVESEALMKGYLFDKNRVDGELIEGWYHTQDIGYFDLTGNLFLTGRKNAMINVGGLKVHPGEVEKVLLQHAGIADVFVTGETDGDSGEYVKAFIVTACGCVTKQDITEYCSSKLASHKVPKEILFVEAIPRSSLGKVLKHSIKAEGCAQRKESEGAGNAGSRK